MHTNTVTREHFTTNSWFIVTEAYSINKLHLLLSIPMMQRSPALKWAFLPTVHLTTLLFASDIRSISSYSRNSHLHLHSHNSTSSNSPHHSTVPCLDFAKSILTSYFCTAIYTWCRTKKTTIVQPYSYILTNLLTPATVRSLALYPHSRPSHRTPPSTRPSLLLLINNSASTLYPINHLHYQIC